MNRSPTCYLHFSFVFHLIAFSSLLIGYGTPYWTLVRLTTGDEVAKGLVVTCYKNGCVMVYISHVRSTFVIVFAMCTASVLISLFVLQVSALAICNMSCKILNMGIGLSYFSFFIALLNGATLALYHLDTSQEQVPEFSVEIIGWSQYCIVTSAFSYLLGASLNIADYTRRNRVMHEESRSRSHRTSVSKLSPQARVDSQRNFTRRNTSDKGNQLTVKTRQEYINTKADGFKTAVKKVNAAAKMAAPLRNDKVSQRERPNRKVFVVSPPTIADVRVNNVDSEDVSYRDEVKTCSRQGADKNRHRQQIKTSNVDCRDKSSTMPAVESSNELKRQSGLSRITFPLEDVKKSGKIEQCCHQCPTQNGVESKDKETIKQGINPEAYCGHFARRGSAVEEALLTVNHFLESAGNSAQLNTCDASVAMELQAHSVTGRQLPNDKRGEEDNSAKLAGSRFVRAVRRYSHQCTDDIQGRTRQHL